VVDPANTPKQRRVAERHRRIVAAARDLAEEHGWDAVTTRRLADTIEYSQPVLYSHFPDGKSQIVTAVALVGFEELAQAMNGVSHSTPGPQRVRHVVTTYLEFAEQHPATYEAMFHLAIRAPFAAENTPRSMSDGFNAIADALSTAERPPVELGAATEVLWAAMHGLATLKRAGRIRPEHHQQRVDEIVRHYAT
jgi:AcrR family transcriptional regulator